MDKTLLIEMIERMSVVATIAFVLFQITIFRRIVHRQDRMWDKLLLAVIFGVIGIFGTYSGIQVHGALANSRVVGVVAAGLVGGRFMGVLAGVIAGGHRYLLGGFSALACALASVCEGYIAGTVRHLYQERRVPWWVALITGMLCEVIQMGIILIFAKPYDMAVTLVQTIGWPMIIVNSLGIMVFVIIVRTALEAYEKIGAEQAQKVLAIATKTLPFLRKGLTAESAAETAKIIFAANHYDAVALTDTERALVFIGAEAAHHGPRLNKLTQITERVLQSGNMQIAQSKAQIGCGCGKCSLSSAVVVPLRRADNIIGTLKLYYTGGKAISQADVVFAEGLAHLFSTQLELTEIDRQAKMAAKAELKALYAQINPHFLFNTLNTITSLVRTKPDLARELLIKLGALFRYALHRSGQNITIAEELSQVKAYLTIEKARHGEKLVIKEDIADEAMGYLIPSLTIQPIIENAIKHGLQPKQQGGSIELKILEYPQYVEIAVTDDGVGIDLIKNNPLSNPAEGSIGLVNVHERLVGQYGKEYGLIISSAPNQGTMVTIKLPKSLQEEVEDCA